VTLRTTRQAARRTQVDWLKDETALAPGEWHRSTGEDTSAETTHVTAVPIRRHQPHGRLHGQLAPRRGLRHQHGARLLADGCRDLPHPVAPAGGHRPNGARGDRGGPRRRPDRSVAGGHRQERPRARAGHQPAHAHRHRADPPGPGRAARPPRRALPGGRRRAAREMGRGARGAGGPHSGRPPLRHRRPTPGASAGRAGHARAGDQGDRCRAVERPARRPARRPRGRPARPGVHRCTFPQRHSGAHRPAHRPRRGHLRLLPPDL
jgi:hypothetical protein